MKVEIKKAEASDIDYIVGQLKEFSNFYGTKHSLFPDEQFARESFNNKIDNHVVFVAWRGDIRLGFISGYVVSHPYNPKVRMLSESFWWVEEQHRMSRAGLMLLDKFTEWGNNNCDMITFSLEYHSPVKDTCLLKRGYKLQERSYIREV